MRFTAAEILHIAAGGALGIVTILGAKYISAALLIIWLLAGGQ